MPEAVKCTGSEIADAERKRAKKAEEKADNGRKISDNKRKISNNSGKFPTEKEIEKEGDIEIEEDPEKERE